MAGIRLYHPTARSGVFTFEHNKRPYRVPYLCPMCAKAHLVKTYHVAVDAEGFAFVSFEVWDVMRRYNDGGFQLANEVNKPPAITIGWDTNGVHPVALEE